MNVGTFYELLDRLPERCDFFDICFTFHDRSDRFWPHWWWVDSDNKLTLSYSFSDYEAGDEFSVYRLKEILIGDENDECECGQEVYDYMEVYAKKIFDDGEEIYFDIINDRFEINWKRGRVDVFIDYA